jgi:hypothetical protein
MVLAAFLFLVIQNPESLNIPLGWTILLQKIMTLFCIKRSRLATIPKLDKYVWLWNGPVFGCPVLAEMDPLDTGLVRFLYTYCTGHLKSGYKQKPDKFASGFYMFQTLNAWVIAIKVAIFGPDWKWLAAILF